MSAAALLPNNAGPFERAVAHAASDTLPVPIAQIMDPATTPAEWLPWLAAHEQVRLWYSDWPEARKRQIVADWLRLAGLIGTRAAAAEFLAYVDAELIHKRSYPSRFPVGRYAVGRHPVQFPTFTARHLVRVALVAPNGAWRAGYSAVRRASIRPPDTEPLRRAEHALVISKAPETAFTVSFAHRVRITLDDGFNLGADHVMDSFRDRTIL
jgi:P2-related tail formation protein